MGRVLLPSKTMLFIDIQGNAYNCHYSVESYYGNTASGCWPLFRHNSKANVLYIGGNVGSKVYADAAFRTAGKDWSFWSKF
jgi:prepilin-type processing-associated H-X9-DG protein